MVRVREAHGKGSVRMASLKTVTVGLGAFRLPIAVAITPGDSFRIDRHSSGL